SVGAGRPPLDVLAAVPGVRDVQVFGDRAHVRLGDRPVPDGIAAIEGALAAAGAAAVETRAVGATLEDVFIDLIGAETRAHG
ncbi:MAG: hypothetical protein ABJC51_05470, partial [Acidobacteriota bacterium]